MSSPIIRRLAACLVVGPGVSLEFPVTVAYDRDDPYAVSLAFPPAGHPAAALLGPDGEPGGASWTFGRDLIADGLRDAFDPRLRS